LIFSAFPSGDRDSDRDGERHDGSAHRLWSSLPEIFDWAFWLC
jgi:hypothetical protein